MYNTHKMNAPLNNRPDVAKESAFAKTWLATGIALVTTGIFLFIPIWRSSRHADTVGHVLYYGLPIPLYEKTESGWGLILGNISIVILLLDCWFWLSLALRILGVRQVRQYLVGNLCYLPLSILILFILLCIFIQGPL